MYGNRGQCMALLMQCLDEMGGSNTKQEVLAYVSSKGYYEITRHDLPPYSGKNESKYQTLIAWARKDCVIKGWINNHEHDAWSLTRTGRELITKLRLLGTKKEYDVRRCYLWTEKLKRVIDPSYEPSNADAVRPEAQFDALLDEMLGV